MNNLLYNRFLDRIYTNDEYGQNVYIEDLRKLIRDAYGEEEQYKCNKVIEDIKTISDGSLAAEIRYLEFFIRVQFYTISDIDDDNDDVIKKVTSPNMLYSSIENIFGTISEIIKKLKNRYESLLDNLSNNI